MSSGTRLSEAARAGNTEALKEILNDDPLILHQVTLIPSDSPLHFACLLGHVDFARLLMERNDDLARERNQQGFTPLHLASSKGHLEIVKDLLRIDREICCEEDQSGRIPLHCAVIRGKSDVVQELIEAYPETASKRTPRGETLLHLAVLNNHFRALPPLIGFLRDQNIDMKELFNSQDGFGQTILHLAVQVQNFQMVKLIIGDTSGDMDLSATNSTNLTALEMAVLRTVDGSVDSKEIEDVIRAAAAGTGGANNHLHQDHRILITSGNQTLPRSSSQLYPKKGEVSLFNWVMMVAALIATLSFQAALNPPGGVWQDWGNNTNNNTTKLQSIRISSSGDEMISGEAPSPHPPLAPHSLLSLSARMWNHTKFSLFTVRLPGMKEVRDENRHMPGKSIARELYPDDFLGFIFSCTLCYYLAIYVIIFTPLFYGGFPNCLPYHVVALCTLILCYSLFDRGISLVTDNYVRSLVGVYIFTIMEILFTLQSLNILLRKWTIEKIEWCFSRFKTPLEWFYSRLKTPKWLCLVSLIFVPLTSISLPYHISFLEAGR